MGRNKFLSRKEKEEITRLLDDGEVGLWLESYDFIFSDFDHRNFSQRNLSQDFLEEAKRAKKEIKPGHWGFKLLVPHKLRKRDPEALIKKRLRQHFHKHAQQLQEESVKIIRRSLQLCAAGFLFMIAAALIINSQNENLLLSFLRIILEPAGWFMVWFGLDNLFYKRAENKPDYEFYTKMSKAEITFESY